METWFLTLFLVARAQPAAHEEGIFPEAIVVAAGLAARVLPRPVKDNALVAADPVQAVVACRLGLERVLNGLW